MKDSKLLQGAVLDSLASCLALVTLLVEKYLLSENFHLCISGGSGKCLSSINSIHGSAEITCPRVLKSLPLPG